MRTATRENSAAAKKPLSTTSKSTPINRNRIMPGASPQTHIVTAERASGGLGVREVKHGPGSGLLPVTGAEDRGRDIAPARHITTPLPAHLACRSPTDRSERRTSWARK